MTAIHPQKHSYIAVDPRKPDVATAACAIDMPSDDLLDFFRNALMRGQVMRLVTVAEARDALMRGFAPKDSATAELF